MMKSIKIDELGDEEPHLRACAQLDADHADPRHSHDEDDAEDQRAPACWPRGCPSRRVRTCTAPRCRARLGMMIRSAIMLLQPPSQPERGPIARRDPAEVGPAVGVGPVEVEERRRDAAHRDERHPHDRGRLEPDREGDESQGGGEAVRRRSRRDPDDGRRREAQRASLQALALDRSTRSRGSGDFGGHLFPLRCLCAPVGAHDRRSAPRWQVHDQV